jgi:signal transduction histidine kinase
MERIYGGSMRRRIALIATVSVIAALVFGGMAIYWAASIEEDQMLDSRLEHLGATVLAFVEDELKEGEDYSITRHHDLKTRSTAALLYRYQIWSRDGSLLIRSHEAPSDVPLLPLSQLGFGNVNVKDEEYRVFALPTQDHRFVIQVAENIGERWSQTALVTAYYVGFLMIPGGLVFAVAWILLRRSMRSIGTMADQLRHRNPLDLTPLLVDKPPQEMMPILGSIDTLFERVGQALSAERRFTSMAAHEMRTPLAGLRAQAQLASSARDGAELHEALDALKVGVDRASHMLDQLLDLARVEGLPADTAIRASRVNLSDTYQRVMQDLGPRGMAKQITFSARFDVDEMPGHEFAVFVLLRNLIANAVLYSPAGGQVAVRAESQGGFVALTVDDSGPGIPAAHRERAFDRFDRLGQTHTEGIGLGLAIVLSVVELHRASIRLLDSPLGGLRVEVLFTSAAQAAAERPAAQHVPA